MGISGNAALKSLTGLDGPSDVTTDLTIFGNGALVSLVGLGKLEEVGGDMLVTENALTSLHGLTSLRSVGYLNIWAELQLLSLQGLEKLTKVSALSITENHKLKRLDPLHDWPATAVAFGILISDHLELPQCEVEAFDAAQATSSCSGGCLRNNGMGTCD